jgi:pimeloyl-ACP methyl ester carboxylesterase
LLITGTDYNADVPLTNSLIIAEKIPWVWLVQIKDAGHAGMSQYPDKINKAYYLSDPIKNKIIKSTVT